MLAVQLCCARHCELPLSKMGNKGLFPGVAVPLAFFCTLFFRHRKKSVSAPWEGKSHSAPESASHSPPWGIAYAKVVVYRCNAGWLSARPPAPLRIATRNNRVPHRAASPAPAPESARHATAKGNFLRQRFLSAEQAGGFPRGKQSARPALPCAPLVVCLNYGSLTAFSGCAHWARASLRSPLHPLRGVGVPMG